MLRLSLFTLAVTLAGSCRLQAESPEIAAFARRIGESTVRIVSGGDRSSGVMLGPDGFVLTCAHGIHGESRTVDVLTHDGTAFNARPVRIDRDRDLALLRITGDDHLGVNAVPLAEATVVDAIVIAAGYPGREANGLSPVLRLGRVLAVGDTSMRTSCTLTSGDSGGPLFDGSGRLAGIHRQIGAGAVSNVHVTSTVVREFLTECEFALPAGPQAEPRLTSSHVERRAIVDARLRQRTVRIVAATPNAGQDGASSAEDAPLLLALGTIVSERIVVTKRSLLQDHGVQCRMADGTEVAAELVREDLATDLAVLNLATSVSAIEGTAAVESGQLVFSADAPSAGLVSRFGHGEPGLPVKLGLDLRLARTGELVVRAAAPNSFATDAGFRTGDRLIEFADARIDRFPGFSEVMQQLQPGDWVTAIVHRGGDRVRLSGALQLDPAARFERTEFLDGRAGRISGRRSGFADVIQHDIAIEPEDCGGPVVDADGRLVGINIARRGRESTLALPLATVQQFLTDETPASR